MNNNNNNTNEQAIADLESRLMASLCAAGVLSSRLREDSLPVRGAQYDAKMSDDFVDSLQPWIGALGDAARRPMIRELMADDFGERVQLLLDMEGATYDVLNESVTALKGHLRVARTNLKKTREAMTKIKTEVKKKKRDPALEPWREDAGWFESVQNHIIKETPRENKKTLTDHGRHVEASGQRVRDVVGSGRTIKMTFGPENKAYKVTDFKSDFRCNFIYLVEDEEDEEWEEAEEN